MLRALGICRVGGKAGHHGRQRFEVRTQHCLPGGQTKVHSVAEGSDFVMKSDESEAFLNTGRLPGTNRTCILAAGFLRRHLELVR